MEAIKRKCRPKHQVLVLKCYPRTTKGAVDIRPNSSELSYLLFYATSRRSKIQKIGAFLEKRTAHDIWRQRVGNVQVTLQILAALIEKSPKDLPLIAQCVLHVLDMILDSNDIVLCESSIPLFNAFCDHHDASSLFADQAYVDQYVQIVQKYTHLASAQSPHAKDSVPVAMRWKHVGLEAIQCLSFSDALSSMIGRQIETTVPVILENLWTDNEEFIDRLVSRVGAQGRDHADRGTRRRSSVATVRTADGQPEPDPSTAAGTAGDVDRVAEEDIGVLAMQCLKKIYVVPNRQQINAATLALFKFIDEQISQGGKLITADPAKTRKDGGWAIRMFELIARWATVQDRYAIVVTAMDKLARMPLNTHNYTANFVMISMISSLLRSDINLIGLSVMDVLLGLMQYMKNVARLPEDADAAAAGATDNSTTASPQKRNLLEKAQMCIGGLATHIYYADQITDMVVALLVRLKPSRSSNSSPMAENEDLAAEGAPAVKNGDPATGQQQQQQALETYFVSNQGRIAALKAVKEVFLVANPQARMASNKALTRNKVPLHVWDDTHMLLRDPDGHLRKAYVDAFSVWLDRETTEFDSRAIDDSAWSRNQAGKALPGTSRGRRAMSMVAREPQPNAAGSRFLQLIHLAVYDNALQYVDFETDYLLLHVLLSKMAQRLGINAVRFGLPMIFRLQEDILEVDSPVHKVRIGCLCHGYFWAVSVKFCLEHSVVGQAIGNEVTRRRSKHFWIEGLNVPTPPVELCGTPGLPRPQPRMPIEEIEFEALLPFDDRLTLIDAIGASYHDASASPPASPPATFSHDFELPVIKSHSAHTREIEADRDLPIAFRDQLLSDWTREAALLAIQSTSKSVSVNGSRTAGSGKNRLLNGNGHPPSPRGSQLTGRPASSNGPTNGLLPIQKNRKNSVRSTSRARSVSNRGYVPSVDQLKQVLMGQPITAPSRTGNPESDDGTESMVSFELTPSEASFNPTAMLHLENSDGYLSKTTLTRTGSRGSRGSRGSGVAPPLTLNPTRPGSSSRRSVDEASEPELHATSEVPPVPPLPKLSTSFSPPATRGHAVPESDGGVVRSSSVNSYKGGAASLRKSLRSRGGGPPSTAADSFGGMSPTSPGMDLQDLLSHIDSRTGEMSLGGVTRPPY
ncbi:hypothetical protein TD95_004545 [Thielaviopsis punctulata]|uniref:Protein EFR3 n=1 Tax=Thielaviopsis punctulata TaxID=72032 RepID=A0A0F4ZK33_9PEZI|nr:hypothetical protein TD95_004545 [Thielaviopsis punctulata]